MMETIYFKERVAFSVLQSHNPATAYFRGDEVWRSDGSVYECIKDVELNAGVELTNTEHWQQLVEAYAGQPVPGLLNAKGTATVQFLEALVDVQHGDLYRTSDAGTVTLGTGADLEVKEGELIGWDSTADAFVSLGLLG